MKRLTVGALLKRLQKLADAGHARRFVGVAKNTFTDELEDEGVNVLFVHGIELGAVDVIGDDGQVETQKDGSIVCRDMAILTGSNGFN